VRWPGRVRPGTTNDQVMISMDWLPTFLAAAGTTPDANYPSDGMNLVPSLTENAAPVTRKLYWRYKNYDQQALRDGDSKYLKIPGNTFLFNVVDDQLERANLKERRKDIYDRLLADYAAWNATMLPFDPESSTDGFKANQLADHIGIDPPPK